MRCCSCAVGCISTTLTAGVPLPTPGRLPAWWRMGSRTWLRWLPVGWLAGWCDWKGRWPDGSGSQVAAPQEVPALPRAVHPIQAPAGGLQHPLRLVPDPGKAGTRAQGAGQPGAEADPCREAATEV